MGQAAAGSHGPRRRTWGKASSRSLASCTWPTRSTRCRGSRKSFDALNVERSAHGPVMQRGQRPAPSTLKAGGQPGRCPASSRSRRGTRTAATKASTARVARPLEPPCGASGMGARYWKGMTGVQPGKVACPPRDQRAAGPVGFEVEASASTVCLAATVCKTVAGARARAGKWWVG